MLILNYCLPPCNYRLWDYLINKYEVLIESPPPHLHLNIDVTKLTRGDIDWMKTYCKDQLIEILPEIREYNDKLHRDKLENFKQENKGTIPKIMKKIKRK